MPDFDVFVSYAAADRAWVQGHLLDALRAAGARVQSEDAFSLGAPRLAEFERAVRASRRVLLVLSPAYLADGSGQLIDLLAQTYGLETATWPVIPLILQPVELPLRLKMLVGLDATDPAEWAEVERRLVAEMGAATPSPSQPPPCPYPGMLPFTEADRDRFFGREAETQELLELLRLHPFLAVIGPSGSGKSSLVAAGLAPTLKRSGLFGPGGWLTVTLRPGEKPLASLTEALRGDPANPAATVAALLASQPDARRLLLIVDQFEELFTLTAAVPGAADPGAADGAVFQQALLALSAVPNCYVVLTARADFYPNLMAAPLWPDIQKHRYEVGPLTEDGLRAAIIKPAEAVGVFVEAALVERLVADAAGEPGILPLVQETLVLLWEHLERRLLPLRAYEALVLPRSAYGAAAGTPADEAPRTGLQVALVRRADASLNALDANQQAIARRIFLRLVQFGQGRPDTRRQQTVGELRSAGDAGAVFDATLAHLVKSRLLTASGEERGGDSGESRKIDISHEALIRTWPSLRKWLSERRAAEETRRRLEAKAQEWARLGRGAGGLLDPLELAEAARWLASPDAAELGHDETLPALVAASRGALARSRRNRIFAFAAIAGLVLVILVSIAYGQSQVAAERLAGQQTAVAGRNAQATSAADALAAQATAESERARADQQRLAAQRQALASAAQSAFFRGDTEQDLPLALAAVALAPANPPDEVRPIFYRAADGYARRVLKGHTGAVTSVAFSPDGKTALSGSSDATPQLWNVATGAQLRAFEGLHFPVTSVAFSPDGQTALSGSDGDGVVLWDVTGAVPTAGAAATATQLRTFGSPLGRVASVTFSPDGKTVLSGSQDGTVQLWDVASGAQLRAFEGHTLPVTSVAFSADGQTALSGSLETVLLWKVATGELLRAFAIDGGSPLYSAALSPDGKMVLAGSADQTVHLWDAATGELLRTFAGHTDWVTAVTFSSDGQTALSGSADNTVRLWDVATGSALGVFAGHLGGVSSVAFSRDGHALLSGSEDRTVRLWDTPTYQPLKTFVGHEGVILQVVFSPDSALALSGAADNTLRLWDTASGAAQRVFEGHTDWVTSAAFGPGGKTALSGSADKTLRLWDVATGQTLRIFAGHTAGVNAVALSPDGTRALSGAADRTLRLWDATAGAATAGAATSSPPTSGQPLWTVKSDTTAAVLSVAFSPNGQTALVGWDDGALQLWDVTAGAATDSPPAAGQPRAAFEGHRDAVNSVAFSRDGKRALSGAADKTFRLWDLATGQTLRIFTGHTDTVSSVAFSPDGQTALSGSYDNTVRLWDVATGQQLRLLRLAANSVALSPDGRLALTAERDTPRLWRIDTLTDLIPWVQANRYVPELPCETRATYQIEPLCQ